MSRTRFRVNPHSIVKIQLAVFGPLSFIILCPTRQINLMIPFSNYDGCGHYEVGRCNKF